MSSEVSRGPWRRTSPHPHSMHPHILYARLLSPLSPNSSVPFPQNSFDPPIQVPFLCHRSSYLGPLSNPDALRQGPLSICFSLLHCVFAYRPNFCFLIRGSRPTSTITLVTIIPQSAICSCMKLKLVWVAAQTVTSEKVVMVYPLTRWYLYSFLAFVSPPKRPGV